MKISLISISPMVQMYGLRTISACLKQAGHDVNLIFMLEDFHVKYSEKAMNNLLKLTKGSDLVGCSLMSNFWDNTVQVTQKLREHCDFPILWGGIHPTVRPEECLDYADMVCIGESEETILELTKKMQNKQYYYDTKGMGFNDKGKKIINKLRELPGSKKAEINSLDQIPIQDYDYKSHYVLRGEDIVKMDLKIMEQCGGEYFMTQPTRGCPFACTFCINNKFLAMHPHQKPIRKRSVSHIIMELQEVKRNLPFVKIILFDDDAFFLMSVDEIKDFNKKYKKHIRLPLVITGATPSTLTKEKLSLLVDAGLVEMRMGIQTASAGTKEIYKRPHTNQQVANAINMIHEYRDQVKASYDIILDSPWDTDKETIETVMFLSKLPTPFELNLFSLVFYPGTEIYRRARKDGLIKDDINDVYRRHFYEPKKTYLNDLYFLLKDYALNGVGISPIIMFILTRKMTRRLHLHSLFFKIIKLLFPFFRSIGRATRLSTRLYRLGKFIKFNGGEVSYRTNAVYDFNVREFHSSVWKIDPRMDAIRDIKQLS